MPVSPDTTHHTSTVYLGLCTNMHACSTHARQPPAFCHVSQSCTPPGFFSGITHHAITCRHYAVNCCGACKIGTGGVRVINTNITEPVVAQMPHSLLLYGILWCVVSGETGRGWWRWVQVS